MRDPETYERFDNVVVVHGVRHINDLAYDDLLENQLPNDELLGEMIDGHLYYYPVVSREAFKYEGRLTTRLASGQMTADLGLPDLDPAHDRAMICGSPGMLDDTAQLLDERGFTVSPHIGAPGEYVIERAFVEK